MSTTQSRYGMILAAAILGSNIAHATAIIAVSSANCTIAGTVVPCNTTVGSAAVDGSANYNVSGLGGNMLVVSIDATTAVTHFTMGSLDSARASMDLSLTGYTYGLVRPGIATYSLGVDGDEGGIGGNGNFYGLVSISGLDSCSAFSELGCHKQGYAVPFMLGTSFQLHLLASAMSSGLGNVSSGVGGNIQLRLFEAPHEADLSGVIPGAPVPIYAAVPEPTSLALVGFGLLLAAWAYWRTCHVSYLRQCPLGGPTISLTESPSSASQLSSKTRSS